MPKRSCSISVSTSALNRRETALIAKHLANPLTGGREGTYWVPVREGHKSLP